MFDYGPVLATIEVAQDFINYKGGVYSSDACNKGLSLFNHTVLVVGYGEEMGPQGTV